MPEEKKISEGLDWFIPVHLRSDAARHSQLRLFVLMNGVTAIAGIAGSVLVWRHLGPSGILTICFIASLGLGAIPLLLRWGARADNVMFASLGVLAVLIAGGAHLLGGVVSPLSPALFVYPVLPFLFLRGNARRQLLALYFVIVAVLAWSEWQFPTPPVPLAQGSLYGLFVISLMAALTAIIVSLSQIDALSAFRQERLRQELWSERVAAQNLDLAKTTAERDSVAKSRLLASIGAEQRTSLTAIIGFSQIIGHEMMGPIGNEQYRSYAEDIESSGYKVLHTIERVIDLARLQTGQFELVEESVDFGRLLRELVQQLRPTASKTRIRLYLEVPVETVLVLGDPRGLRQILMNLLTNALRYTDLDGSVRISLKLTDSGMALLQVDDTGPGISNERLRNIYDPLQTGLDGTKADNWTESVHGLGLPISRLLAERHDGTLEVASVLGQGTTVTLSLPRERVTIEPVRPAAQSLAAGAKAGSLPAPRTSGLST